jgi:4-amino-4-deoxy-L-arabinose transferase-like glycosyltransferase
MGGIHIPDIGAPDELEHVSYVQFLLDGKGLPVLDPDHPNAGAGYQSHQPPLFYFIEAGVSKLTGQSDLSTKSAGLILRATNVLIGCSTVAGVFFLGFWGYGKKEVGLAAAAFLALLPMNLALSGAVSNDPLLFSLCTWSLAVAALGMRQGWGVKRAAILGVLLGLAMLTKTTAAALVPAVLLGILISKNRPNYRQLSVGIFFALLLVAPWWVRNQSLYGDPFAMKAFNLAFKASPTRASIHKEWGDYVGLEFLLTRNSFIGAFGYMDIFLPQALINLAAFVLAVMAAGGIVALRKPGMKESRGVTTANIAFILLILLSYIAFNVRFFQAQARYLFPALGPICVGFGLGLVTFGRERWKQSFIAFSIMLTVLNLWIVTQFLPGEFSARALPTGNTINRAADKNFFTVLTVLVT